MNSKMVRQSLAQIEARWVPPTLSQRIDRLQTLLEEHSGGDQQLQENIEKFRTDCAKHLQEIKAHNDAAAFAGVVAHFAQVLEKGGHGLSMVIRAHDNGADGKEVANGWIRMATGFMSAVPSAGPLFAAVGGICNSFLGGNSDRALLQSVLTALKEMINTAVQELKNHISNEFRNQRYHDIQNKIEGCTQLAQMLTRVAEKCADIQGASDRERGGSLYKI